MFVVSSINIPYRLYPTDRYSTVKAIIIDNFTGGVPEKIEMSRGGMGGY